ncbi:MAG: heme exporter protein CcmD [Alkalimonas sp.]|uniref:Heme exporter protein D n=1 Tax=Alkalimonas delamerensis TaxID=265981 RepID=A0ABT9GMR3_9GAMM|nr:heme exporter protein CcmD [Alkalimonas delamerensis]MCC5851287.1 heme exporter protein CcmD [Alkalimonas sp.]MDP4528259.1 heme exporter protein CcmD [Alkalimonas delamerensis]
MQFDSFSDFLAMGGYGFYIWLAYGLTYGLLVGLAGYCFWELKAFHQNFRQKLARAQRVKQYQETEHP